tara:strand:- start:9956 stop:10231 length:276 start_codon:yes stop_codon:yes gene_type:complete
MKKLYTKIGMAVGAVILTATMAGCPISVSYRARHRRTSVRRVHYQPRRTIRIGVPRHGRRRHFSYGSRRSRRGYNQGPGRRGPGYDPGRRR